MYRIEYFRQGEVSGSSLSRSSLESLAEPTTTETVEDSSLYFGNPGFVVFNSSKAPFEILKVVPCHRVKSITKIS